LPKASPYETGRSGGFGHSSLAEVRRIASGCKDHAGEADVFLCEFIKSGKLPKEIGRFYNKAFEYRQKFDYVDFISPDKPMVVEYVEAAAEFVSQIKQYLGK
jgi:uncharacterized protein (UPF0332 family)